MFRRIVFAAAAAGLIAGALVSLIQSVTTIPIILQAELYEGSVQDPGILGSSMGGLQLAMAEGSPNLTESEPAHAHAASAPRDVFERTLFTTLANLVTGVGSALLVVGGMALYGRTVTAASGVLWGAAGFAVFTLAPALGLPPEVPGTIAADLSARQIWWAFAVAGAALGLGLLVFAEGRHWKVLGVIVAAGPHMVGAPHPHSLGGSVPPELAGQFAATSIVVAAIFWALIGSLSAAFYRRFA